MPDQFRIARERMVSQQLAARGIRDERVLAAMSKVPRHLFVDEALRDQSYSDFPLPIGHGQTISQPYIVALMTELLGLQGYEKVLEIGTGSGYQTAILAELSRFVYSVERISALLFRAKTILHGMGYSNVHIKLDDGTWGWRENAPYDAILVTAGAPYVPEPLLEQLADSAVMVIPVGDEFSQTLVRVHKSAGRITQETITGVRFVKLVGEHGWRE
jgi:protein-L-isoaspartate(D-aspartate) O-methyltransferase